MAEAALTFLLNNVQKLLMEQLNLISGAEKEVNLLKRDLKLMLAVLEESAEKGEKGKVFLELEKQIREAVYDAEDALDAWLTQKSGKASGILSRPKTIDLAKKVKELRLNDLKPLFDQATQSLTAMPKQHASGADHGTAGVKLQKIQLLREDNVVGFADEEATLIKYINSKTEHLDVISIVGMPGLGKTTLAWKIYRNQQIEFDFPVCIWVYVSQDFNMREVCLTILKKFTDQDMSHLDAQDLIQRVRSRLEKGKFLLFLDDVWTFENWTVINYVLPRNNKLGKVLITSRHAGVAAQANCNRVPHQLRFLKLDESWELLQLEVFGKKNGCPEELKGLGKDIADKCGGVPLAVVVIGGILVEKSVNRTDSWKKVSKSVSEYLIDDKQKRTENIISLSYNKLPYELRDCFLYIGVFPEDTEIPVWKLIRLWIAEGFIQEQENQRQSLEEVAEENLNELVARNLVRIEKTKANGDIKTCRVHDMIREFCQNEAAFANKNLFQEVRMMSVREFRPEISDIEKRRRLCIHSNVLEFFEQKPKGPKVRSFLCFSKDTINLPAEYTPLIPDSFNLLRVIDVNPIKFAKFPSKLNKLIHLRYLTMSGNNFTALPDAVSGLWNLQTVMIQTTSRELEIKADIGKMKQLRHFKTKAAIVLNNKVGKGEGGEKLQTLSRLSAKCCTKGMLSRASNLKNLGIRGNIALLHDSNSLAKLEHLEKLKLVHDTFPHQPSENALSSLPPTHNFPPKLRILTLSSTYLDWTEMDRVKSLCHLAVLKLKENAFKGSSWRSESHKFPCLESLHITRTDLMTWTASDNTFPKLKTLILKNCERLEEIPSQLGKALQLVEIERVTPTLVESAKAIQAKKQQMQGQEGGVRYGFKLKISPGDALATTSSIPN